MHWWKAARCRSARRKPFSAGRARHSLLFAGGIGVTPILSMARVSPRQAPTLRCIIAADPGATAFHRRIADAAFAGNVQFHFDAGAGTATRHRGRAGRGRYRYRYTSVCLRAGRLYRLYRERSQATRWSGERIHFEYFAGAAQDESADRPFDVKLSSSGKTYTIPVGKSVISVLAEMASNCRLPAKGRLRHLHYQGGGGYSRPSRSVFHR